AIDVDGVDADPPLALAAHALGPGLGAEDADAHGSRARIDALPLELVGDGQHVGRRHQHDARAKLTAQLDLPLAEAARHGHHRAAELLRTVVRAQPTGEQTIATSIVDDVSRTGAAGIA